MSIKSYHDLKVQQKAMDFVPKNYPGAWHLTPDTWHPAPGT